MPKSKKGRVIILVHDMSSHPFLPFYQIPSKNIPEGIHVTECTQNQFQKLKKVGRQELSFLDVACRLVLVYISTKYHKNIPKGIHLTERTRNQCIILSNITKGENPKNKKGELSFL